MRWWTENDFFHKAPNTWASSGSNERQLKLIAIAHLYLLYLRGVTFHVHSINLITRLFTVFLFPMSSGFPPAYFLFDVFIFIPNWKRFAVANTDVDFSTFSSTLLYDFLPLLRWEGARKYCERRAKKKIRAILIILLSCHYVGRLAQQVFASSVFVFWLPCTFQLINSTRLLQIYVRIFTHDLLPLFRSSMRWKWTRASGIT